MAKFYIKTYGCQMNEYDSDKIKDILDQKNQVQNPKDAEIILLNTCSVREKAQEKVFSELGRLRNLKKQNPNILIAVGGCVASQEGHEIIKRSPFVDLVFGPQTLHRLPQLIKKRKESGKPQVDISFPEIEKFDNLPVTQNTSASAYVSIMEGCSKYCSFCVVPYTRGEEFYRPLDDVLTEISILAQKGVKEINLLGQNVNAYHVMEDDKIIDFADLLHFVHEIPGIERIRFTTSHPREFTNKLIKAYENLPKLVSHLHLPVQSGSDRILAAMKRGYTALEYKSIVRKLRAIRPDLCLSSDFIVGFPGESEHDFECTRKLVEDLKFDASFVFIYSPRPGTPAADLIDDVPYETKQKRLEILNELINEVAVCVNNSMLDTVQEIIVSEVSRKNKNILMGRSWNNRAVYFSADPKIMGQMVKVRITSCTSHSLQGILEE